MSPEEQLIEAAQKGDLKDVQAALTCGASVHAKDGRALKSASHGGYLDVVEALIKAGANVHAEDDWALRWASHNGHPEVVQVLIKAGADVHASDDLALRWAAENGHVRVIERLVAAGADPDHPCLEEAAQKRAALRAWLEHRRLSQSQPETSINSAQRGLSRVTI